MKVVVSSVVLAALLGFVNAKVQLTNSNFDDIEAGSTFEITWTGAEGPVTLTLKDGDEDDLKTVQTITTNASGDSFVWPVDAALPSGDYALEIDDGTGVNYSEMFPIDGTDAPTSSTASSSSTVTVTRSTASPSTTSSESSSTESTSTESTSTKTTSSETSTSSAESTSTASHSTQTTVTRTTSSTPTPTESEPAETSVPNTNDAHNMAAPLIPGILALLGAALI